MEPRPPLGRILTFYSYKGGTGRSMALANTAWILASNGFKVLAIDWDLEAPGLHRYFRPFLIDGELSASEGLMDFVDNYANAAIRPAPSGTAPDPDWYLEYTDFSNYIVSINFRHFRTGGKIDFLPAGRQGDHYALSVSSFNWQNLYDRLGGGGFFEAVKKRARESYDYVLIDSRTGVSDTAGICSVQMPDTLVVCFTYNNQSIKGAGAVARSATAMHDKAVEVKLAAERASASPVSAAIEEATRPYRIFPVPMRVDSGESDRLAVRQGFAREEFAALVAHIRPELIAEYWKNVEIPHTVFYAYEEVLAPFKDDAQDPKTVLAALLRLTKYITDDAVTGIQLAMSPEEKQTILDSFAETPAMAKAKKPGDDIRRETEEEALVRGANTALASLPENERLRVPYIAGRLVRIGREEEGGGYFPIRANLDDFTEMEKGIVTKLASHRVLTISSESRSSGSSPRMEQTVGLSDARLLSLWKVLIDWVDSDREFLTWRLQLRNYLKDWERSGGDHAALLGGRLLGEADLWAVRRSSDLTASETDYIRMSKRATTPPASALETARMQSEPDLEPSRSSAYDEDADTRSFRFSWKWIAAAIVILTVIISVYQLYRVSTTESTPIVPVGDIPISGAPALPPADTNRQIQEQITLGDGFFVKGDANSALDAYSKALQLDPKNNRAYQGVSQAREAALAAQKTQVALHYITAGNREVVSDIWAELRDTLKPMEVLSPDLAKGSTRGEIWYYSSENEKIAASVKKSVEFVLARTGFKVELKTVLRPAPSGSKKNTIEIWLPDLKPGVTKS